MAALTGGSASAAPQIVNVCGRDDAPGGLNLAAAMSAGGEIVIRCPAGQQTIELTGTRHASGIVHLDGEGKVTLRGPVAGPLFTADISLRLSRLTVENARTAGTAGTPGAGTVVLGRKASVELEGVTTRNSFSAYVVKSLVATGSTFLGNGDATALGASAAIIDADTVELRRTTFAGNFDHPIGGGSPPVAGSAPLSRRVVIEDSTFSGNRSTLLLIDARVSIRRTKFEGNGTPPDKWGRAWECCGGAITLVRVDAELADSAFSGNGSSGFGGAVYALGSTLRISRSVFEGNQARAGGAVVSWGRRPKVNVWSTEEWPAAPLLELRRVQFRKNTAMHVGGALVFAGPVEGDAVLFRENVSGGAGGAIAGWDASPHPLPPPYDGVFVALLAETLPVRPDRLALARLIVVDNVASGRGAALAVGAASVTIGNGLIARNRTDGVPEGAISGQKMELVNSTVADNPAGGLIGASGTSWRLRNSILLRNAEFNCAPGIGLIGAGHNLQHPGNDCGAAIGAGDPGLDGQYAPGLISAARGAADTGLCAAHPQVLGVDLLASPRLQRGRCDIGAIERTLPQALSSALGLGAGNASVGRLWCLLVVLALLLFVLCLLWIAVRRHRRRSR